MAVAHRAFRERPLADYASKTAAHGCFIDVKSLFDPAAVEAVGLRAWRL